MNHICDVPINREIFFACSGRTNEKSRSRQGMLDKYNLSREKSRSTLNRYIIIILEHSLLPDFHFVIGKTCAYNGDSVRGKIAKYESCLRCVLAHTLESISRNRCRAGAIRYFVRVPQANEGGPSSRHTSRNVQSVTCASGGTI